MAEELEKKDVAVDVETAETNEPAIPTEAEQRAKMVERFNQQFGEKYAEIECVELDQEYKDKLKAEFDEFTKSFVDTPLQIGETHDEGLEAARFLKNWNAEMVQWENQEWRGVIHFDDVITERIEAMEADSEALFTLDIYAVMFLFEKMKAPHGTGLDAARTMADLENTEVEGALTYTKLLEMLMKHVNWVNAMNKKGTILQQAVAMADDNFKMNLKISEVEEFVEFYDMLNGGRNSAPHM